MVLRFGESETGISLTSSTVNIALAGIAGYGDAYLEAILPKQESVGARLVGVVDPQPQRCKRLDELNERNIPIHPSMQSLFAQQPGIDLMLIVTPIHLHATQTCFALQHGANVLCEKPIAGTLRDALRMAETQEATSKQLFAAIGYQWSFSQAVQSLKCDILDGALGRPIRMKSLALHPRPMAYFRRNDWAGRLYSSDGAGIFDSPANNATAHFLHNMFYLLGPTRETSAMPATVQAELYRANDIENFDTAAIRCHTDSGVEVLFYTSHAVAERRGPRSRFEFELGHVDFDTGGSGEFVARFNDGRVKYYGHPNFDRHEKIWQAIDSVRTGKPVACGIPAAMAHAICIATAQESAGAIVDFPGRLRRVLGYDGEAILSIDRLGEQLIECYEREILPSEHSELPWARAGRLIDLKRRNGDAHAAAAPKVAVNVHPAVVDAALARPVRSAEVL
jgi:predicted dehydrogenase